MRIVSLLLLGGLFLLASACSASQPPEQSDYILTATVKEIMDSTVEPNADFLWNSVAVLPDTTNIRS